MQSVQQATGVSDCVVQWSMAATATEDTGACAVCDFGLDVAASINVAGTTCPEELYEGDETWDTSYAVQLSGGAATFYFASSGNSLGEGYGVESAANYITEQTCVYF